MQQYLDKFNKLIRGAKSIDIQFLNDNPLSIRNERNNQGGMACYCLENETIGKQKVKNLWQNIECTGDCQYLKKDSNGKKACNRIAWLKFFIPSISNDRVWLMRITSQDSINNLKAYINMQKLQGNSLKGIYTIFLQQKEQVDWQGKIHNNYVLDIIEKINTASLPSPISTQNTVKDDFKKTELRETANVQVSGQNDTENQKTKSAVASKSTVKKETKKSTKKTVDKKVDNLDVEKTASNTNSEISPKDTQNVPNGDTEIKEDFALISTSEEILNTANGEKKYVVGQFCNMNDEMCNVYIRPDFAEELQNCDLGTMVNLTIKEKAGKKFAIDLIYLAKCLKEQAV